LRCPHIVLLLRTAASMPIQLLGFEQGLAFGTLVDRPYLLQKAAKAHPSGRSSDKGLGAGQWKAYTQAMRALNDLAGVLPLDAPPKNKNTRPLTSSALALLPPVATWQSAAEPETTEKIWNYVQMVACVFHAFVPWKQVLIFSFALALLTRPEIIGLHLLRALGVLPFFVDLVAESILYYLRRQITPSSFSPPPPTASAAEDPDRVRLAFPAHASSPEHRLDCPSLHSGWVWCQGLWFYLSSP